MLTCVPHFFVPVVALFKSQDLAYTSPSCPFGLHGGRAFKRMVRRNQDFASKRHHETTPQTTNGNKKQKKCSFPPKPGCWVAQSWCLMLLGALGICTRIIAILY